MLNLDGTIILLQFLAAVRALASNQYDRVQSRHQWQTWVEFNLLLILSFCSERFSLGSQVFSSPQKLTFPNSIFQEW